MASEVPVVVEKNTHKKKKKDKKDKDDNKIQLGNIKEEDESGCC